VFRVYLYLKVMVHIVSIICSVICLLVGFLHVFSVNDEHTWIPLQDIICMMHNRVSDAIVPNASCFPLISFVVVYTLSFRWHTG
jgi:hypothetical protein